MKITYDSDAHAFYIYFQDVFPGGKKETIPVDENIVIDYDEEGKLFGIEILSDKIVDVEKLKNVQFEDITGKIVGK